MWLDFVGNPILKVVVDGSTIEDALSVADKTRIWWSLLFETGRSRPAYFD